MSKFNTINIGDTATLLHKITDNDMSYRKCASKNFVFTLNPHEPHFKRSSGERLGKSMQNTPRLLKTYRWRSFMKTMAFQ